MELLGQHLPNIEELYLAGNDLSDLPYQDDSADPSDKQSGEINLHGFASIMIDDV